LEEFEVEVEQRRENLKGKEKAGEKVDWQAFENDCEKRRNLLLAAYRQRRLPRVRAVQSLLPYLVALTTSQPSRGAARSSSASPSW